jgi:hypothetical protein
MSPTPNRVRLVTAPTSSLLRAQVRRFAVARRVSAYSDSPDPWLRILPATTRRRLRIDVPPAGSRWVEIGSGWRPTPGYVHVEPAPGRPDVHLPVTADAIPLPAGWADEVLSVHVIEHIVAGQLETVLAHWRDLLHDGGRLVVHTPNVEAIADILTRYDEVPAAQWWAAQNALFGYGNHPDHNAGPGELGTHPDHVLALSWPALRDLLAHAGFTSIEDVSGTLDCQHQRDWAQVVPGLCLEVHAVAAPR